VHVRECRVLLTLAAGMASFLHLAETTTDQSRFGYSNIKLGCGVLLHDIQNDK